MKFLKHASFSIDDTKECFNLKLEIPRSQQSFTIFVIVSGNFTSHITPVSNYLTPAVLLKTFKKETTESSNISDMHFTSVASIFILFEAFLKSTWFIHNQFMKPIIIHGKTKPNHKTCLNFMIRAGKDHCVFIEQHTCTAGINRIIRTQVPTSVSF